MKQLWVHNNIILLLILDKKKRSLCQNYSWNIPILSDTFSKKSSPFPPVFQSLEHLQDL